MKYTCLYHQWGHVKAQAANRVQKQVNCIYSPKAPKNVIDSFDHFDVVAVALLYRIVMKNMSFPVQEAGQTAKKVDVVPLPCVKRERSTLLSSRL